jgi:phage terminase large subunit
VPKKLSSTAEKVLQLKDELSDEELAVLIQGTPDWRSAFREPEKEKEYPSDPVEFMRDTLGYTIWPKLEEIAHSVESNHNTVVASGVGVGKSIVAAAMAMFWVTTRSPSACITIGPTWDAVDQIIWRYIRTNGRRANLPGRILETPNWDISSDRFAYGASPKKSSDVDMTSIQGRHNPNQLVILDEASGLSRLVWRTVSLLSVSENNRLLAIGNPIGKNDAFSDACHNKNWNCIRISCLEHPNVIEGREVIPGAVSRQWIEQQADDLSVPCDPDTPGGVHLWWCNRWIMPQAVFVAKVLGEEPEEEEDQLIKLSWVTFAENNLNTTEGDATIISCDPAPRAGDYTACAARNGNKVLWVRRKKTHDTVAIVSWIQELLAESAATRVYVDETGAGVGVVDTCRLHQMPVVAVNSSRSATQKRRFANTRSEMWWNLREALRKGDISLPKDIMLESELVSVRLERNELHGRILLEDKKITSERIQRSPDSADAVALLFTLPNAGSEINVELLQNALTRGSNGQSVSRWTVYANQGGKVSRWRR